jgi:hypothetical protein
VAEKSAAGPAIESGQLSKLWAALDGLRGLTAMQNNGDVMVALALYWQLSHPETRSTTERLRSDARRLRWHVARLRAASNTGKLDLSVPYYAPQAVDLYYGMAASVLELYAARNTSMLAALKKAL